MSKEKQLEIIGDELDSLMQRVTIIYEPGKKHQDGHCRALESKYQMLVECYSVGLISEFWRRVESPVQCQVDFVL